MAQGKMACCVRRTHELRSRGHYGMSERQDRVIAILRDVYQRHPKKTTDRGPGVGDKHHNRVLKAMQSAVQEKFPEVAPEYQITVQADARCDLYDKVEGTAYEVAFGLHRPASEYEKDLFKAMLLADQDGAKITGLIFVTTKKGVAKCEQPFRSEARKLVERWTDLSIGFAVLDS